MKPPVGGTVLYTLGHNRQATHGGYTVCFATVLEHNADGTLVLLVHAPHLAPDDELLRPWVPPGPTIPGGRAAAGKWSPAPAA